MDDRASSFLAHAGAVTLSSPGELRSIFVAPKRGAPILSMESVEAHEGRGLEGDRYTRVANKWSDHHQVTLIESEHIEAFARATKLAHGLGDSRRNLVTRGVRLNDLVGKRFRIGGVEMEGMELCEPCKLWAKRTHPEILPFFKGKGGLRARILNSGTLRVGDEVAVSTP